MKNFFKIFAAAMLSAIFASLLSAEKINFVFDTDIGNDIDDALALSMLFNAHKGERANLSAIFINKKNIYAPIFVDILENFYGVDVPIALVDENGKTPDEGKFNGKVAKLKNPDGSFKYVRQLSETSILPEAATLLRKILTGLPDKSVVYISVGFSTNLANFFNAKPIEGEISNIDLFAKKVKFLSVMAGDFSGAKDKDGSPLPEYNVSCDVASFQTLIQKCPVEIFFSGYEIGRNIFYPHSNIVSDFPAPDPIADAYNFYSLGKKINRESWDETSVLFALRPELFKTSHAGFVECDKRGGTSFKNNKKGLHRFLILDSDDAKKIVTDSIIKEAKPIDKKN